MSKIAEALRDARTTTGEVTTDELPEQLPMCGQIVAYIHGDPTMIGADPMVLPLLVTDSRPEVGRIDGLVFMDPKLVAFSPDGNAHPIPPIAPAQNVPFSTKGQTMSWHWPEGPAQVMKVPEKAPEPSLITGVSPAPTA